MATKRSTARKRKASPERRIDVTRLEYQSLLDLAQRSQESIRRLEMEAATQFKRTVEQQTELDALKRTLSPK